MEEQAESPMKKSKNEEEKLSLSIHSELKNLSGFKVSRVLGESSQRKTITLQGSFEGHEGIGIVLLEKKSFLSEKINYFFCKETEVEKEFSNDIYGNYEARPPIDFGGVKATVIHPATEKHLQKYQAQKPYYVNETPELYKTVCLPHLLKEQFNIKWVLNILEHKAETDRIVFEDPDPETGFMLVPDLKWNCEDRESLYLIAIVRKLDIKSIRDLTAEHLPMLRNVMKKGTEAIEEKYGVGAAHLRVFLHYRPSFYHLHMHFVALQYDAPGIYAEKAHPLSSVIANIELLPDFYQKASLPFIVRETESLFSKLEEHESQRARCSLRASSISSLLIELRPRLGACQFHVQLSSPQPASCLEPLQVCVTSPQSLALSTPEHSFTISLKSTQLVPDTLSSLIKHSNSISFRVQTNPELSISGSFSTEVILPSLKNVSLKICLPIAGEKYDILCRACTSRQGAGIVLARVLPLPSSSWSEVDWFCHRHEGDAGVSSSPLSPRPADCLHGTGFVLLHAPSTISLAKFTDGEILCCCCNTQLGTREENTATVWSFAVVWQSYTAIKFLEDELSVPEALERDLRQLVLEAASHTAGAKILLSSKTDEPVPPLLLWALNSPLEVSVLTQTQRCRSDLSLPPPRAALALLFRQGEGDQDDAQVLSVPPPLLEYALISLQAANQLYPEHSRSSDGFNIGFIYK